MGIPMNEPHQSRKTDPLQCDLCGHIRVRGDCRPFTLLANVDAGGGAMKTRSFGSIDLCSQCWRSKAAPRRQKRNTHEPF